MSVLVCILIYLSGFEQAVLWGCFCSLLFIISGRNADTCKQSLFKAFFFLFSLENSNSKSWLWFSECMILVRPLNAMLIINWLSMSSFSYHSMLAMGNLFLLMRPLSRLGLRHERPGTQQGAAWRKRVRVRAKGLHEPKGQWGATVSPRAATQWEAVKNYLSCGLCQVTLVVYNNQIRS